MKFLESQIHHLIYFHFFQIIFTQLALSRHHLSRLSPSRKGHQKDKKKPVEHKIITNNISGEGQTSNTNLKT